MRKLFLLVPMLVVFSCAHQSEAKKEMRKEISAYEYKNHEDLKDKIISLLETHPELSSDNKAEIRDLMVGNLDEHKKLKIKESKIAQHLLHLTIMGKDKGSYSEIQTLRKEMKKNYEAKMKLFDKTAVDLKKILDINIDNTKLIRELGVMYRL